MGIGAENFSLEHRRGGRHNVHLGKESLRPRSILFTGVLRPVEGALVILAPSTVHHVSVLSEYSHIRGRTLLGLFNRRESLTGTMNLMDEPRSP